VLHVINAVFLVLLVLVTGLYILQTHSKTRRAFGERMPLETAE